VENSKKPTSASSAKQVQQHHHHITIEEDVLNEKDSKIRELSETVKVCISVVLLNVNSYSLPFVTTAIGGKN